jgi:hypothetical protein
LHKNYLRSIGGRNDDCLFKGIGIGICPTECEYEQNDTRGELFNTEFNDGGVDESEDNEIRGELVEGVAEEVAEVVAEDVVENVGEGGIGVR